MRKLRHSTALSREEGRAHGASSEALRPHEGGIGARCRVSHRPVFNQDDLQVAPVAPEGGLVQEELPRRCDDLGRPRLIKAYERDVAAVCIGLDNDEVARALKQGSLHSAWRQAWVAI